MSKVILLEQLKDFTQRVTAEILLPVALQKGDSGPQPPRAAQVFLARVPDGRASKKKAPYILHQAIAGRDEQPDGQQPDSTAIVRTVFCVYHPDEQEGGLALLTLMEQLRIALLERPLPGAQFVLDRKAGIETVVYSDEGEYSTAPYYLGEMMSTWHMPPVRRLDTTRMIHGMPPWDPNPQHTKSEIDLKGSE